MGGYPDASDLARDRGTIVRHVSESPFLTNPESDWVAHNALAFAIRDKYPVSPGTRWSSRAAWW